jgi:NitT/TauT family transport system substrate-binding protein
MKTYTRSGFGAMALGTLAAWTGVATFPARAQSLKPLTVATIGGDIGAQVFYGKDLGYFERAGLDVQIVPWSGGLTPPAVLSGSVDIAFLNAGALAAAHAKGLAFRILAPANLYLASAPTAGLLAVLNSSTIAKAKDFQGKTVAVNGTNALPEFAVRAWIDKNGGDSTKTRFLDLQFIEMASALQAGRIDAAAMDTTADPRLGKRGDVFRLITPSFSAVSPRFVPSVWYGASSWIASHPAEAQAFAVVMRQTAAWANSHHTESAAILGKYSKMTPELLSSIARVTYGTELSAALIQPNIDLAAKYGALPATFDAQELIAK